MTATLEIPPPFEALQVPGLEGTGEPSIARLFLGVPEMGRGQLSHEEKQSFDDHYWKTLNPILGMRNDVVNIRKLIADHKEALRSGTIVRRAQPDPLLSERIDNPLRSHTVHFLEMADALIKNLPSTMKFFEINIDYMADREQRFAKYCERYEAKDTQLVAYLRKLRPFLLDIEEQFRKMRVEGWNLSNVKYTVSDGVVLMVEPLVGSEPMTEYVDGIFSILALAAEEIVMYGFQRKEGSFAAIAEIPLDKRDPDNAQRFNRTLRNQEPAWELKWTGKGFYRS